MSQALYESLLLSRFPRTPRLLFMMIVSSNAVSEAGENSPVCSAEPFAALFLVQCVSSGCRP